MPYMIFFLLLALVSLPAGGCGGADETSGTIPVADTVTTRTSADDGRVHSPEYGMAVGDDFALLDDEELEATLADIAGLGFTWIRFDMAWSAAQPDGPDTYNWQRFDRIVDAANRQGLKMLPVLTYTPAWARPQSCMDSFKCAPADPAAFARYTGAVVKRYSTQGIDSWEIWNEPNIGVFWQPVPDAARYTELLKQSYISIKREDPRATVVSAGLAPASNSADRVGQREFLSAMYANGARDYFDALGYHPFSYPLMPSDVVWWSGWSIMSDVEHSIRSIMVENGDGDKKIWATEFGAPSAGPRDDVSEALQALSIRDAFEQAANKPWLATLFFFKYRDLSNDPYTISSFFGIISSDGERKPAYYEVQQHLRSQ